MFWACTRIALQGFGGVLAVVQRELVDQRGWLTQEQFIEDWAVAQILPGPNVVNLMLMLGDRYFGLRGALAAAGGMLLVPMVLLIALAMLFAGQSHLPEAQGALRGMGAVAAGLVAGTGLKLLSALGSNVLGRVVAGAVVAVMFVAITWLRAPLALALLLIGLPACLWAAWRLRAQRAP